MVAQATLTRLVMVRIHAGQPSGFLIQKIGLVLNTAQEGADVFFGKGGVQHLAQKFGLRLSSGRNVLRVAVHRPRVLNTIRSRDGIELSAQLTEAHGLLGG